MSTSTDPDKDAPVLPGFQFVRHLGSGGFSEVYQYEQEMPRRNVAVKVLNRSGLTEEIRSQFTAEANAMAGLADHPSIVGVFGAAIADDGRPCLVMQYCPQANLAVRSRREHFSVTDVLSLGIKIGSAVEAAHRNEILHRDIKPHNVLTNQYGAPALTDFGIAAKKGAAGPGGLSVPWSPPEVVYGSSDGDERADVYSLAATLWHMLVGRSPFELPGGDNGKLAIMGRIQADPPPPTGRRDMPESLERLLRQAMAKDPAARPQTALDLVRALQAIEQELNLPLTPIVLAAEQPSAVDGTTDDDDEATRMRGAQIVSAAPPSAPRKPRSAIITGGDMPGGQADGEAAATRARDIARVGPAPGRQAGESSARQRHPLPESPVAATGVRPAVTSAAPAQDAAHISPPGQRNRRVRLIGVAAAVILVLAGIAVALSIPRHGTGHGAGGGPRPTGSPQGAIGPGASAPGVPAVVGSRAGTGELRFRWTYANHAPGDVFRWRRVSGGTGPASGITSKPVLELAARKGQSVCITIQVVRADGSQASSPSAPVCES